MSAVFFENWTREEFWRVAHVLEAIDFVETGGWPTALRWVAGSAVRGRPGGLPPT
jgi:hypothetical protein